MAAAAAAAIHRDPADCGQNAATTPLPPTAADVDSSSDVFRTDQIFCQAELQSFCQEEQNEREQICAAEAAGRLSLQHSVHNPGAGLTMLDAAGGARARRAAALLRAAMRADGWSLGDPAYHHRAASVAEELSSGCPAARLHACRQLR
eukprot:gene35630-51552_t